MAVTAEIKTGRRMVISYLLSPLVRFRQEGLRATNMTEQDCFSKQMQLRTRGTFEAQDGQISFLGMLRVSEEGVNVFRVMMPGRPPLYGEWQPIFEPNGNDLNVAILKFGYLDAYNVGNLHPDARAKLKESEIAKVKHLIRSIFKSDETRKNVNPFTSDKAKFLGEIRFCSDWILADRDQRFVG